jgi:hypothetical protein
MEAIFLPWTTGIGRRRQGRLARLALLVGLATSCTYDASRLQRPGSVSADAPVAAEVERDVATTSDPVSTGVDDAGRDESSDDRADTAGHDDGDRTGTDDAGDVSLVGNPMDAADLPRADEVGGDVGGGDPMEPDAALEDGPTDGLDSPGEASGSAGGSGGGRGGAGGSGGGSGGQGGGAGGATGRGGTSGAGGGGPDPDLVLWYKFDEGSGTTATDSSLAGAGTSDGVLATTGTSGSATFTADCQVGTHALSLAPSTVAPTSSGGYVTTPAPTSLAPEAITIAVWVKLAAATTNQDWERIFDFGNGTGTTAPYVYMTARDAGSTNTPVRFGLSNIGHSVAGVQTISSTTALTANEWHHLAIVLPAGAAYTGTLYIDGAVAGTNPAMTLHLSDVGPTTQNWLGRSPFTSDPYFYGSLDDFRIYRRALTATEIADLVALR